MEILRKIIARGIVIFGQLSAMYWVFDYYLSLGKPVTTVVLIGVFSFTTIAIGVIFIVGTWLFKLGDSE